MSRPVELLEGVARRPIEAIEKIIALTVLIFGLYLASPFFVSTTGGPISESFGEHLPLRVIVAFIFYIGPALPLLVGSFTTKFNNPAWHARATLGLFIGLTFLVLLRVIMIGVFPMTWLFTLALGLIVGVCHLYWKVN